MSEEQSVVESRTRILTTKVKELKQGKDEIFLALLEAMKAQVALEEIRLALDTNINEDDYEEITNQAIEAIVLVQNEYGVGREPSYETPQTFSTYDAERLRYLVDADD